MKKSFTGIEQAFFRRINSVVEPLVSRGVGSPRRAPASLIVLESTGFKSGQQRRTPLWSLRLGPYRLISTARGKRSFWVKNLQKKPVVRYSLGGEHISSEAILLTPGFENLGDWQLNYFLTGLVSVLGNLVQQGWAFAILVPDEN